MDVDDADTENILRNYPDDNGGGYPVAWREEARYAFPVPDSPRGYRRTGSVW